MGPRGLRVIAVVNQKGGVGKTTTAINLGTALAAIDERVLIVDLDPQGNASTGLGVQPGQRHITTYDVLTTRASLGQAAVGTSVKGLSIVPATSDLVGLESELLGTANRNFRLRDAIAALIAMQRSRPEEVPYSYILIDCPPSLNTLTVNAMAAADSVLVPVQCEFFALEGISQLKETIDGVRASLNPKLDIHGVVLTMHDPRAKLSGDVVRDVRAFFGDKVYSTIIPRNVKLAEAPSHGQPILSYDIKSPGSQAYVKLAEEIILRERRYQAA
ncbi:MAG: ParA family protein [Hyphomicrobiaceae bacterium]